MKDYDLPKLMKWCERVMQLERLTGKDINEMLGKFADTWLDCSKCPLKDGCNESNSLNCDEIWKAYLEVKY